MQTVLLNFSSKKKEDGTWLNQKIECKLFGRSQMMRKNDKVTFKGNIAEEQWEKDGKKHSKHILWVNDYKVDEAAVVQAPSESEDNIEW